MQGSKVLPYVALAATLIAGCSHQAPPSPAEQAFVDRVSTLLIQEYPTRSAAQAYGYTDLTGKIDSDNTYNLTDMDFSNVTLARPNFLWFDRKGNLAGTDYEFPKSAYPKPPAQFPVNASRWTSIDAHVHLAYTLNGKTVYAEAPAKENLQKAKLTSSDLKADGLLPDGATLKWAMYHPDVWDLALWVVPNPRGAFAEDNPLVK